MLRKSRWCLRDLRGGWVGLIHIYLIEIIKRLLYRSGGGFKTPAPPSCGKGSDIFCLKGQNKGMSVHIKHMDSNYLFIQNFIKYSVLFIYKSRFYLESGGPGIIKIPMLSVFVYYHFNSLIVLKSKWIFSLRLHWLQGSPAG